MSEIDNKKKNEIRNQMKLYEIQKRMLQAFIVVVILYILYSIFIIHRSYHKNRELKLKDREIELENILRREKMKLPDPLSTIN